MKAKNYNDYKVTTGPRKVVEAVKDIEAQIATAKSEKLDLRDLKDTLNYLFILRKKQKNYTPPPVKLTKKKGF